MKKKLKKMFILFCVILCLLALLILSWGFLVSFVEFRKESRHIKAYGGRKEQEGIISCVQRIEFTEEEYSAFRIKCLEEGWSVSEYQGEGEIAGYSWSALSQAEKEGVSERLYRRIAPSVSSIFGNKWYTYENVTISNFEDKVIIIYEAHLSNKLVKQ